VLGIMERTFKCYQIEDLKAKARTLDFCPTKSLMGFCCVQCFWNALSDTGSTSSSLMGMVTSKTSKQQAFAVSAMHARVRDKICLCLMSARAKPCPPGHCCRS
jgi:hypothetical protein